MGARKTKIACMRPDTNNTFANIYWGPYYQFSTLMRLQFQLKKVKINRHAEQLKGQYTIGQLYGALYEDQAHITNVLAYPDADNIYAKEELEAMDRRHEEKLHKYNLDEAIIGWYLVSYKQNLWDQLVKVQYYEKYINTCFFLVYDYEARLVGKNPYRAFRLTDQFALKENFSLAELADGKLENPFVEIPVEVQKDEIFECLMLFNKKQLIAQFAKNRGNLDKKDALKNKVQAYLETLDEQLEGNKANTQKKAKQGATFNDYCNNLGTLLKAEHQEQALKKYEQNVNLTKRLLSNN